MAGIGFELRKAIRQDSPIKRTGGYIGAAFSCSGSILVGIVVFAFIKMAASRQGISQDVTDTFMCYVTNVMFLSMLVVSPLTLLLSRYVSDQMYIGEQNKVMPSLVGGVVISTIIGVVLQVPLLIASTIETTESILLMSLFLVLNVCWLLMTYITLLRDYKQIVVSYMLALVASCITLGIAVATEMLSLNIMLFILIFCFSVVDIVLFRAIYIGFSKQDNSIFAFMTAAKNNPSLIFIGMFMTIGMLGHFWMVWFLSGRGEAVNAIFRFGPDYDFPAIVAYFSTIPSAIYFVTLFETKFSECYQTYFVLLGHGGTVSEIENAKDRMFEALYKGFRTLCSIQLIACLLFVTVGAKVLDVLNIGMTQDMLNTFRIFCVGYSLYYIGNVVTLVQLYFANEKKVFWSSMIFAIGSNVATFIGFYYSDAWGIGFTIASFLWMAIVSIQMVIFLSNLEYHILAKQPLVPRKENTLYKQRRYIKINRRWIVKCSAFVSALAVFASSAFVVRNIYYKSLVEEIVPAGTDAVLKSPGIGLAPWAENEESMEMDTTLVYVELKWSDWEPTEGEYNVDFVTEYYNLEYYREDGRQVVFRFICDEPTDEAHIDIPEWLYDKTGDGVFYDTDYGMGYSPNYENELFVEKHRQAIYALGEAFGSDDFFCYIELGSLGHWGEWHVNYEQGVTRLPDYSIRQLYIEPYLTAFPNAQYLLRYPLVDASLNGFGLYNDMTGDYDETLYWIQQMNGGVWEQTGLEEQANCTEVWKSHPIGGEFASSYDDRVFLIDSFDLTLEGIQESHQSFIGPKIIIDESDNSSYSEAIEKILKCLGYRFSVSRVTLDFTGKETLTAVCTFTNDGIAPIYQQYQVVLYIYDEDGDIVWESEDIDFDLTNVLPGEEQDLTLIINKDELDDDTQYVLCAAIVNSEGKACIPMALEETVEDNIYALAKFSMK